MAAALDNVPEAVERAYQARVGELKAIYQGFLRFCSVVGLTPETLLQAWWRPVLEEIEELRPLMEGDIPINEDLAAQIEQVFRHYWPGLTSDAA